MSRIVLHMILKDWWSALSLRRRRGKSRSGTFAFIIHPRSRSDYDFVYPNASSLPVWLTHWAFRFLGPVVVSKIRGLTNSKGEALRGWMIAVPLTAAEMQSNRPLAVRQIKKAAKMAVNMGAEYIGLGGQTASLTSAGAVIQQSHRAQVVSGSTFAVINACQILEEAFRRAERKIEESTIAIVGAAGAVGSGCREMLDGRARRLILVELPEKVDQLQRQLEQEARYDSVISVEDDLSCLAEADGVLVATNHPGSLIDPAVFRPGAIMVDDSAPPNVSAEEAATREDVLFLDGSTASVKGLSLLLKLEGLAPGEVPSCLAELCLVTYHEDRESPYTGLVSPSSLLRMKGYADSLGVRFAPLRSFGRHVIDRDCDRMRAEIRKEPPEVQARRDRRPHAASSDVTFLRESFESTLRLRFRAVAVLLLAAIFIAAFDLLEFPALSLSAVACVVLLSTWPLRWFFQEASSYSSKRNVVRAYHVLDIALVSITVILLGGVSNIITTFFYLMLLLNAGTALSRREHLAVAGLCSFSLIGIAVLEQAGLVHPVMTDFNLNLSPTNQAAVIGVGVLLFVVIAVYAGQVNEGLRTQALELLNYQHELEEQNVKLEARVRDRTRQLQESLDKLASKSEDLEDFVRIVTHDLQNETSLIQIEAELARRRMESGEREDGGERLSVLVKTTRRIDRMLRSLVELFSVPDKAEKLEMIESEEAVQTALIPLEAAIREKGIDIRIEPLPTVYVPKNHLNHVFANLLSNAVKYVGDKAAPSIRISTREEPVCWQFSVADNGIGINARSLPLIFKPFRRGADQEVAGKKVHGTGIGLPLARKLVERWGGELTATSERGKGSVFSFTIPK